MVAHTLADHRTAILVTKYDGACGGPCFASQACKHVLLLLSIDKMFKCVLAVNLTLNTTIAVSSLRMTDSLCSRHKVAALQRLQLWLKHTLQNLNYVRSRTSTILAASSSRMEVLRSMSP